jgi:hydroxymethylbilane synthase
MNLRVGTRSSLLATSQTGRVVRRLEQLGHRCEVVTVSTLGDRVTDRPFDQVGPPGVFVRDIEQSLLDGEIDVAVHSYKDLPTVSPAGLVVAAVPERLDPADILVVDERFWSPSSPRLPLASSLSVGTSSSRRRALLHALRPDLTSVALRGNVPTRLNKCREEEMAAVVLAASGLQRLKDAGACDLAGLREHRLDPAVFVPAPSQGALALQVRLDSSALHAIGALDDPRAHRAARSERAILAGLEGGCQSAIGAWLEGDGDSLRLHAAYEKESGLARFVASGTPQTLNEMITQVIDRLR